MAFNALSGKHADFFLTDLRSRIVGVTPIFDIDDLVNPAGIRFLEIQKYLAETGNQHRHWLALDNDASLFPRGCQKLILCNGSKGFGDVQANALFLKQACV